jgi:hypothetical protein
LIEIRNISVASDPQRTPTKPADSPTQAATSAVQQKLTEPLRPELALRQRVRGATAQPSRNFRLGIQANG